MSTLSKTVIPFLIVTAYLAPIGVVAQESNFAGDAPANAPASIELGHKEYSPYLHRSFPNRVLWGDTHLHTSYSVITSYSIHYTKLYEIIDLFGVQRL